jgi:hypothetical protein
VGGCIEEEEEAEEVETTRQVVCTQEAAAVEAASPLPVRQPSLARSLFATVQQPAPQPVIAITQLTNTETALDWEMTAEQISSSPILTPDNLDIPAFMRRRMALMRK